MTHVFFLSHLYLGLHLDESVFIIGIKAILLDYWNLKVHQCNISSMFLFAKQGSLTKGLF